MTLEMFNEAKRIAELRGYHAGIRKGIVAGVIFAVAVLLGVLTFLS